MSRSEKIREIVEQKQHAKVEGMLMDLFSASAFIKVYDHVREDDKKRLQMEEMPLDVVMNVVWRCVS